MIIQFNSVSQWQLPVVDIKKQTYGYTYIYRTKHRKIEIYTTKKTEEFSEKIEDINTKISLYEDFTLIEHSLIRIAIKPLKITNLITKYIQSSRRQLSSFYIKDVYFPLKEVYIKIRYMEIYYNNQTNTISYVDCPFTEKEIKYIFKEILREFESFKNAYNLKP
ncbi:MAG: hypothetical protein RMI01_09190 [Thermodesulfovibrio sp.]|nr:hypothetical protein [Thermodesulfovibrio sp.]